MSTASEQAHPRPGLRWLLFILLALGTIGAVIWANVWKDGLKVKEVRVEGNRIIHADEILATAAIQESERLFSVDLFAAEKRVSQNPFLKSVTITRDVPGRITISVVERVPVAAIALEKMMYLDNEGYVLPPVRSEDIFDIPVLTGTLPRDELIPGQRVSSDAVREAVSVLTLAQRIDEQLYRKISEVHTGGKDDLVFYTADAGVPVIVGHEDIGIKLVKFECFWRQMVDRRGAQELQYIDLRFRDQVVVKWNQAREKSPRAGNAT